MIYARILYNEKESYALVENERYRLINGDIFGSYTITDEFVDNEEIRLLAPCCPSKIVAVGLNYIDHAKEMGLELPSAPTIFIKPSTAVIGTGDIIKLPAMSERVDYEAELAIVIKKTAKAISPEQSHEYILGYTCLNDVTARDLQKTDGQWTRAKGFDTFAPIGPVITDEIDPDNANITLLLNKAIMQQSNTVNFIYNTAMLVSFISQIMTLLPGDVITTGTPSGIGPMKSGDEVSVVIDGIGRLTNIVL